MVSILQCHPTRQPEGTESGSRPNVYNAEWTVVLDDQVDLATMLQFARDVNPTATITPLPRKGTFFRWTSAGVAGNVFRRIDRSAIALDFTGRPFLDDGKKWRVDVRWRAPTPGAEEEPDRVNRPPLRRRPYYWLEYYTETEEVFDARPTINIGQGTILRRAGERGPITTAAGEEVDLATDERLHMVLVSEFNASSPRIAAIINALYFGRINRGPWQLPPEFTGANLGDVEGSVARHKARFLRAESSQFGEWWDGEQYFKTQVRVRVATVPFYKQIPNRGTWYYNSSESRVQLFRDDDGVLGKTNLTREGTIDNGNVPFLVPYQIAGERNFTRSLGFV